MTATELAGASAFPEAPDTSAARQSDTKGIDATGSKDHRSASPRQVDSETKEAGMTSSGSADRKGESPESMPETTSAANSAPPADKRHFTAEETDMALVMSGMAAAHGAVSGLLNAHGASSARRVSLSMPSSPLAHGRATLPDTREADTPEMPGSEGDNTATGSAGASTSPAANRKRRRATGSTGARGAAARAKRASAAAAKAAEAAAGNEEEIDELEDDEEEEEEHSPTSAATGEESSARKNKKAKTEAHDVTTAAKTATNGSAQTTAQASAAKPPTNGLDGLSALASTAMGAVRPKVPKMVLQPIPPFRGGGDKKAAPAASSTPLAGLHAAKAEPSAKASRSKKSNGAASSTSSTSSSSSKASADLTPQEVEKFLQLVEKHNYSTDEAVMAESLVALYNEWVLWCNKTGRKARPKSKLMAEFPKIRMGHYGPNFQSRAMVIISVPHSRPVPVEAPVPPPAAPGTRPGSTLNSPVLARPGIVPVAVTPAYGAAPPGRYPLIPSPNGGPPALPPAAVPPGAVPPGAYSRHPSDSSAPPGVSQPSPTGSAFPGGMPPGQTAQQSPTFPPYGRPAYGAPAPGPPGYMRPYGGPPYEAERRPMDGPWVPPEVIADLKQQIKEEMRVDMNAIIDAEVLEQTRAVHEQNRELVARLRDLEGWMQYLVRDYEERHNPQPPQPPPPQQHQAAPSMHASARGPPQHIERHSPGYSHGDAKVSPTSAEGHHSYHHGRPSNAGQYPNGSPPPAPSSQQYGGDRYAYADRAYDARRPVGPHGGSPVYLPPLGRVDTIPSAGRRGVRDY